MIVFAVSGWSGAGKTHLITRLIAYFRSRGKSVMAAKHAGHSPSLQPQGKDSRAYLDAGAGNAVVISGSECMQVRRFANENEAVESIREQWNRFDVVLLEGRIFGDIPVVEVMDESASEPRTTGPNLVAVVSEGDSGMPVPHFRRDEVEALARFMEERNGV